MGTLFDPKALELAVQRHLAEVPIPEGKRVAVVTVANQDSVKVVTAIRGGDNWTLGGFVDIDRQPDDHWGVDWGVTVKASF